MNKGNCYNCFAEWIFFLPRRERHSKKLFKFRDKESFTINTNTSFKRYVFYLLKLFLFGQLYCCLFVANNQENEKKNCNQKIQLQQPCGQFGDLIGKYFVAAHPTDLNTGSFLLADIEKTFLINLLSRKVGFTWKCLRPANYFRNEKCLRCKLYFYNIYDWTGRQQVMKRKEKSCEFDTKLSWNYSLRSKPVGSESRKVFLIENRKRYFSRLLFN